MTTHAETPGMGARAKTDPGFAGQFTGLALDKPFKVTQDGGGINAISGATITSRAVTSAATEAAAIYEKHKAELDQKVTAFKK